MENKLYHESELDCPYEFTSRCTLGRCDCKPKSIKKEIISFQEFEKSCYHTQYSIVIPLVNRMQINKLEFFTKGKLDNDKLRSKLMEIYEEKFKK